MTDPTSNDDRSPTPNYPDPRFPVYPQLVPAQSPEMRFARLVIRAVIGALIGLLVARATHGWLW
jgi:hypothetical protein